MELGRAVLGGALIGAAATLYWRANGRVAGVSGVLRGALLSSSDRKATVPFLVGLVVAGLAAAGSSPAGAGGLPILGVAGFLVGLGTRVGGGTRHHEGLLVVRGSTDPRQS